MARNSFKVDKSLSLRPQTSEPTVEVVDGDLYYDSTLNAMRARINGVWVDIGSGSGDASSLIETLKNQLNDSYFEYVTPNIFSLHEDTLVDGSSTGAYVGADKIYQIDSAETMVSVQMLDADFLANPNLLRNVQFSVFWNLGDEDTAATYEVSRDGGNEYQTVTMERVGTATDTYTGALVFDEEAAKQSIYSIVTSGSGQELDDNNYKKAAQEFTLSSAAVIKEVDLEMVKTGSPAGYMWLSIVADDGAGEPGTDVADILCESDAVDITTTSSGTVTFNVPDVALPAGTYHAVVRTDDAYKSSFVAFTTSMRITVNNTGAEGFAGWNGSTWFTVVGWGALIDLKGSSLDLRVRITSSAASKKLTGYGVLYDMQQAGFVDGNLNRQVFAFDSATNPNEFTLTSFTPDPELLEVFLVETGQVFKYGAFSLDGKKVVFPADSFDNGGVSADMTLIFMQSWGANFDNSDVNANLLATNHLGSTDAAIDRSVSGRGLYLRRPDGTLREIAIDDSDNIVVYSV